MDFSHPVVADALIDLDDDDLESIAGPATLARGLIYAKRGHVVVVTPSADGAKLTGVVHGSRGQDYRTTVWLEPDDTTDLTYWHSTCTCPMTQHCKHTVALVAAARARLGGSVPGLAAASAAGATTDTGRAAVTSAPTGRLRGAGWEALPEPDWEQVVAGLAPQEEEAPRHTRVALLIEPVAGPGSRQRLQLRPLARGKQAWVRNVVTWTNIEHDRTNRAQLDPDERRLLTDLAQTYQRRNRKYYIGASDKIHVDDLGPGWWATLSELVQRGIPLVADVADHGEVHLIEGSIGFVLDVQRDPATGDARLTPLLAHPPEIEEVVGDGGPPPVLIGDPPFGAFAVDGGDLLLARLDPPLDRNQARFLALGNVRIPAHDVDRFLATHAPGLRRQVTLVSSDGSIDFPEPVAPTLGLTVTHLPGHRLVLSWHLRYHLGEQTAIVPPDAVGSAGVPRDPAVERELLVGPEVMTRLPGSRIVTGGRPRLVPVVRLTGLSMLHFLDDVLPALEDDPDITVVVEGERLDYAQAEEAPVVRLTVTDPGRPAAGVGAGGTDWFDLGVDVTVGDQKVPLATLLTALTHGEGHVILDSGTWFRTDTPELEELRRLLEEARAIQDDPDAPIRLTPYQADLWAELVELGVVAEQSERWSTSVAALGGRDGLPTPVVPAGLRATLRPYQVEGFEWLTRLRRAGLGGILADDMGLGKTLQTLAMILDVRAEDPSATPVLVVAPTSVLTTWEGEVARFCPDLRVVTLGATSRKRGTSVAAAVEGADLVLTSYAVFRLDAPGFREMSWTALVLDEAQFAKNHQSLVHQCARRLPARVKLAITGTPMENNLMELWSLLSIVAPGLFPSPTRFSELYRRPIESGAAPERLEILRRRIRPVVLRRRKETVATELPPKQEQIIEVTLSPKHRRIYDTHLQRERQKLLGLLADADHNRIAIFRSLTRLRQLSLDPALIDPEHEQVGSAKLDTLLEMVEPIIAEGHRVLVFSQFTSFLARLRTRLGAAGIDHAYLDGSTRDRAAAISTFRDGAAPLFLISLKAGGFGLNLTEADYVFLLDPWWNPAAEAQAIDRTHRIGQDKHVMVYRLVSADTIEEKVVALQNRKRELFGQVIDGGALQSGTMTADDIRGLLLPD